MIRKYLGLMMGFAAIVAGYALLAGGDITVAPLLLVLGYCVLVPLFLLRSFLQGKGE
ncbi:MAG: hypothetical protein Q7W56_02440 [Candidatus Latescibacteria bacterium]|nr:hypothetical protein [Candidatus Latescibacterota bacterium]